MAICLDAFASLATMTGDAATAVRLWASTDEARKRTGERRARPFEDRL